MASIEHIKAQFMGKSLAEVPTPSVVLDIAKIETNCSRMLSTVKSLGFKWRAHIKSHKTTEITRLQLGTDTSTPANIIVSTILEAEKIVPLLKEYQREGRKVNILYSFPLYASSIPRLAAVAKSLGPGSLTVMIDNAAQIPLLAALSSAAGFPPLAFVKIDMGTHRAGVPAGSEACNALIADVLAAQEAGTVLLEGLYAHAGHSYDARTGEQAGGYLYAEYQALADVAATLPSSASGERKLTLSVGATPTATTLQNPEVGAKSGLVDLLSELRGKFELEVHAGVYPLLDLQQLATKARPAELLSSREIAITVLAEVASLYPGRGANGGDEALVNAGSLALGREPCKDLGSVKGRDYVGWGVVSPWRAVPAGVEKNGVGRVLPESFPAAYDGFWYLRGISQEHGVLAWGGGGEEKDLKVGDRVRIWPNHACIAGAGHNYYLVVDSRKGDDEVVDVWERWNGW